MIGKFKDENGGWNWKKVGALFLVPVTMWTLSTWYGRYSWIRDQCYKVATNESLVVKTAQDLEKKDDSLQKQLNALREKLDKQEADFKAELDKANMILHTRITEEANKREAKDDKLTDLFIDQLRQQQKQIELQQKQLEDKAE